MAVANTLAYYDTATITAFVGLAPRPNPLKKSWGKFSHSFSVKLDRFSALGNIVYNNETVQLSERVKILAPKKFNRIGPAG
jgi:hypothetical protein